MIVDTLYGPMDALLLKRVDVPFEDSNEKTDVVEYWLDGELVHRSAVVNLKHGLASDILASSLGG